MYHKVNDPTWLRITKLTEPVQLIYEEQEYRECSEQDDNDDVEEEDIARANVVVLPKRSAENNCADSNVANMIEQQLYCFVIVNDFADQIQHRAVGLTAALLLRLRGDKPSIAVA